MYIDFDKANDDPVATRKMFEKTKCEILCKIYEDRLKKSGNPLYAWETYQKCRKLDMPVPKWVLTYLDEVAANLMAPLHTAKGALDKKNENRIAFFLQRALFMKNKGAGDCYKQYSDIEDKLQLVWEMHILRKKGLTIEDAKEKISLQTGVPEDTLHKIFYKYIKFLTS